MLDKVSFEVKVSLHQGSVLSPLLFAAVMDVVSSEARSGILYMDRCLEPENVNNSTTTRDTPKRRMKETLFTGHRSTVEPMMIAKDGKATLQATHT